MAHENGGASGTSLEFTVGLTLNRPILRRFCFLSSRHYNHSWDRWDTNPLQRGFSNIPIRGKTTHVSPQRFAERVAELIVSVAVELVIGFFGRRESQ